MMCKCTIYVYRGIYGLFLVLVLVYIWGISICRCMYLVDTTCRYLGDTGGRYLYIGVTYLFICE